VRKNVQNKLGKEWTQVWEEHLWEDREDWKFCYKVMHPFRSANIWWWWWWRLL